MHLPCSNHTLTDSLVYLLRQLFLLFLSQFASTFPVMLVEATAAATVTAFLLLLLENVEDLLGIHICEPAVDKTYWLTILLRHSYHRATWVTGDNL